VSSTFVYVIFVDVPIEQVWKALTLGEFTRQYWAGRRIESSWQPGSPVHIYLDDTSEAEVAGEVIASIPNERLSYTWKSRSEDSPGPARVSFELLQMGGSVRLTLTHDPLPEEGISRQGWAAIMSSLKSYLETGRALNATAMFRRSAATHRQPA
jgi:uncharacterized protein YndB with AHSA1/START domain